MIGFGEAIGLFYRNYVNFEGRATRAEYWWPTLLQIIVYTALFVSFVAVVGTDGYDETQSGDATLAAIMIAGALFWLVNLLPGISVKIRRFHDLDQSGWLVLAFWAGNILIPLVEFARMIWFAFPGREGSNQYGPDPFQSHEDIFG